MPDRVEYGGCERQPIRGDPVMLQCYMCGSKIREGEGQRRHIVTGTRSAQVRGGDRFDMRDQSEISVAGARTELRMLCAGCAADHDARQRRNTLVALAVFAVVAVLFAAGAFFAWNHFQEEKRKADQDFERD